MPLHGEHFRAAADLERFDNAVLGGAGDNDSLAGATDCLVMQAVGRHVAAVNLLGHAAWRYAHRMAAIDAWVIDALVRLSLVEVLHQRTAECDVQQLRTAAHAQHRQARSQRRTNQR